MALPVLVLGGLLASATTTSTIGLRFDCLHDFNRDKGSSQSCLTVRNLRYGVEEQLSPQVKGRLVLDPFGSVAAAKADTPLYESVPQVKDTPFVLVDDYAIIWTPRANLEVAAESYPGSARIMQVSGLATAGSFGDTGWKQTALTVAYSLPAFTDMKVKLAAGNGEGENGKNLDPQQYFGFEVGAAPLKGVRANLGVSFDGNNVGSAEYAFLQNRLAVHCPAMRTRAEAPKLGYSTQRIAAGLGLDGSLPAAEGLKLALGWQRNVFSDLDKARASGPALAELDSCDQLDIDSVFVEDPLGEAVNTVQRTTIELSVQYRLFGDYFFAADYAQRHVDTGSVQLFKTCRGFTGQSCSAPGSGSNALSQTAFSVGGGIELAGGFVMTLEYNQTDYDKTYAQAFYADQNGKTSDTLDLFDARLSYNWQ